MNYQLNESDKWNRQLDVDLVLDLYDPSLNGVKIDDDINSLNVLGKSDHVELRERSYQYKALGLTIVVKDLKIKEYHIIFRSFIERLEDMRGFKSFNGSVVFEGESLPIEVGKINQYLQEVEHWDDGVEKCYQFVRNGTSIECIFDSHTSKPREIAIFRT